MTSKMKFEPGVQFKLRDKEYLILHVLDFESILVECLETGDNKTIKISEVILHLDEDVPQEHIELSNIPDEDWQIAQKRFDIIRPFIKGYRGRRSIEAHAKHHGINYSTIYRWLKAYESTLKVSSLLPTKRPGGKGKNRLSSAVNTIINDTIKESYLSKQRKTAQDIILEIRGKCRNAKLPEPHPNTIRNRISAISEQDHLRYRKGRKEHKKHFEATPGKYEVDFPLHVIQIDHTELDIILVDDIYRQPVGRPWITLAIDVFSRMIAGYYISFDRPNSMSVGACLSQAILPKDKVLSKFNINTKWPLWGVMNTVHMDNAKEFKGNMLKLVCNEYDINLEFRPIGKPQYGGHIERLLGTFNTQIHSLPGTTFSGKEEKGDYDSEKYAALSLSEFEKWLLILITEKYHQEFHSGISMTPINKYKEGIFGNDQAAGTGLPEKILDERKLILDFMPYVERTVQKSGVYIDNISYFHDVLIPFINKKDNDQRTKKKYIFKRDPRDISIIYFYNPELKEYYEIPYRNTSYPPMTLWELRSILTEKKEEGRRGVNEDMIFEALEKMRNVVDDAVKKTKSTRKSIQRRNDYLNDLKEPESPKFNDNKEGDKKIYKPFDDIREL